MSDPDRDSWLRRIPVLGFVGVAFMVLGLLVDDQWAFYVGGALLVIASLQWGRPTS